MFWRADVNPAVVTVEASPASHGGPDAFDIWRLPYSVTVLLSGRETEHVLIGDGVHRIQLAVRERSLLKGPVRLRYDLAGLEGVETKLTTLRRLLALRRLGRFPRFLFPPERRAGRWIMALRALDGSRAGAQPREIAGALFGDDAALRDWDGESDYLRSRTRRAIAVGKRLANRGYFDLMR